MAAEPLVSCIMPTHNRRRFVAQAIAYFERQDYPFRELIVVDDGDDAIGDLVPVDDRFRYVRIAEHMPLGRKRNLACEQSRGEIICHWDDDDWYARDRVRRQVDGLLRSGCEVCGVPEILHYRLHAGEAWLYSSLPGERRWVGGGTLVYHRSAWEHDPFPDVHVGEDAAFMWQLEPDRVHALPESTDLYVALLHDRNTASKNLADRRWTRRPLDEVSRLLTGDRAFYAALRNGGVTPPQARPASAIKVAAPFLTYDGYGSMAEYLVLGLERAGAQVDALPLGLDREGLTPELLSLLDRSSSPRRAAAVVYFSWPSLRMRPFASEPDLFVNTMWESSQLPAGWAGALNRARAVIVPTPFVAQVCRDSGVEVPLEVIPEGVDPAVYRYEERPARETFTTLVVATVVERKHTREAIAAWKLASGDDPLARLVIKARFHYRNYRPDDPRIRLVDADEKTRGIAHWYREADVLLALGNEGFGLPLVEGMATGLPVIALDSEGQSDTCSQARDLLLAVAPGAWQRCDDPPFGLAGVRGVPDVKVVADRLRWVAAHRDEVREMGRAAAAWARTERDVWKKGPAVLSVIEQGIRSPRSLRSWRLLWTPQLGRPCGVAEHTRDLSLAARAVTATATPDDLRGVRLLHAQHEPSLVDDRELMRIARRARSEGVPMVVTEHAIRPGPAPPWEREVSALVATTQAGALALRSRSPAPRVEHIPLACPPWRPQRREAGGRVIGVFGFLERHKGFEHVLAASAAVDAAEVVVYSHPKRSGSARATSAWPEAACDVPVRWEQEFLATDEIVRRLSAEADVLVYWYDETGLLTASGAVLVGLATGVPVLTSATQWFRDVRDATYQPDELVAGIGRLLEDEDLRRDIAAGARAHCEAHSWKRIALRHEALWRSLESA